jgi:cytochrome c oxidase subunit IV
MSIENSEHGSDQHSDIGHAGHIGLYFKILLVLLFLTVATVGIAQVDFGSANLVIAMLVASVKALLVAMFFMHLKYEDKIIWLYAVIPIILLLIMLIGVFIDSPMRVETKPFIIEKIKD